MNKCISYILGPKSLYFIPLEKKCMKMKEPSLLTPSYPFPIYPTFCSQLCLLEKAKSYLLETSEWGLKPSATLSFSMALDNFQKKNPKIYSWFP